MPGRLLLLLSMLLLLGTACDVSGVPTDEAAVRVTETSAAAALPAAAPETPLATASRSPAEPPSTPTPVPTSTPAPTATSSATPTPTATATPIPLCAERKPDQSDLLVLVNHNYGLSPDYKPEDLVPLADYFPTTVTRGYPTQVRAIMIEPLEEMVTAMQEASLRPLIVSGFRGYYEQSVARQKWVEQYPDWAHNLSAVPGHSEHQLGTTIDFSSPELPEMVGEAFIEFHPAFASSPEGSWLAEHAAEYGFTMSYPDDRFEETGFLYEPWHFRYVGAELATQLRGSGSTISEFLLAAHGPPCLP